MGNSGSTETDIKVDGENIFLEVKKKAVKKKQLVRQNVEAWNNGSNVLCKRIIDLMAMPA